MTVAVDPGARRRPSLAHTLVGVALVAGLAACAEPTDRLGSVEELATSSQVFQRGTFGAVADSYLSATAARQTFGAQKKLVVSAKNEVLLRFELSTIPANAVIDRAALTLFVNGGEDEADDDCHDGDHEGRAIAPIKLHRATAPWTEGTVTYKNFDQRFDPAVAGVLVLDNRHTLKTVDVKALVQAWVSGAQPNYGLVLTTAGRAHTLFASSEHGHVRQRPALAITYTVPDDHCAADPCQHGGTCSNGNDGFTCTCVAGYQGDRCETEIDDCAAGPCVHGACSDVGAGYTCACDPGYAGGNCEIDVDECAVNPCIHGGTCTQGVDSFTCACPAGYTGARCEVDIDECADAPCQHGGTCTDLVGGYACTCAPGYEGTSCELDHDDCSAGACVHGTCQDGVGSYTCACEPGYEGARCDQDIADCTPDACRNGGTCLEAVNGYTCACEPGFTGAHCEVDIDECAGDPCDHGLCVDEVNAYSCRCDAGYDGPTCGHDIDDCAGDPCQHGGACTDGVAGFACTCTGGYTGVTCEVPGAAATQLAVSSTTLVAGAAGAVNAQLVTLAGAPVSGVTVSFSFDPGGLTASATTDAAGVATAAVTVPAAGVYTLTAGFAGDPTRAATSTSTNVQVAAATTELTASSPATGDVGAPLALSATLARVSAPAGPLAFAPLVLTITGPAGVSEMTVFTDANGTVTAPFTAAEPGHYAVTVGYAGDLANATASASFGFDAVCPVGTEGPTCTPVAPACPAEADVTAAAQSAATYAAEAEGFAFVTQGYAGLVNDAVRLAGDRLRNVQDIYNQALANGVIDCWLIDAALGETYLYQAYADAAYRYGLDGLREADGVRVRRNLTRQVVTFPATCLPADAATAAHATLAALEDQWATSNALSVGAFDYAMSIQGHFDHAYDQAMAVENGYRATCIPSPPEPGE